MPLRPTCFSGGKLMVFVLKLDGLGGLQHFLAVLMNCKNVDILLSVIGASRITWNVSV